MVAPFFIPKTAENATRVLTDEAYREILRGYAGWQTPATALARAASADKRFFNWFLEFPDVFVGNNESGFDCVLGNPPWLGGQKLSGNYGDDYLQWLRTKYSPAGAMDLVGYFFRRAFTLARSSGFQSLLATNTVVQGGTREGSIDVIVAQKGVINHATKSAKWPGTANADFVTITITKQPWKGPFMLAGKEVSTIPTYLDDAETKGNPYPLEANTDKSFQGSIVLGKGFVLEPDEARRITDADPKYHNVIFP